LGQRELKGRIIISAGQDVGILRKKKTNRGGSLAEPVVEDEQMTDQGVSRNICEKFKKLPGSLVSRKG